MAKCLVLGGNGFIGSHLAEGLVQNGYDVTIFDSFKHGEENLDAIIDKVEIVKGDFLNESDVCNSLKDVDLVFHYISTTTPATAVEDPVFDIRSNLISSVKLFQNAEKNNVKKIIYASSGGTIYGNTGNIPVSENAPLNPVNPYSISKLAIENYLHYFKSLYGIDYQILRYSNPYGERQNPNGKQGVIPAFLNNIKNGKPPLIYGDGTMVRDYIYIKDAIDATIALLEKRTNQNIFNIGSGKGTSLNELIEIMSGIFGYEIVPEHVEPPINYTRKIILDISRIREEIDWIPATDITEGLEKTIRWKNSR